MFKVDLEKAEEPGIKLPTSPGWWKKQESFKKTFISAILTMPKPLTVWITINCGKFFKRWEYQTTWPASWKNLYSGQKAAVRTGHETTDWFQIGKELCQGCILSPCLFNLYAEYIMYGCESWTVKKAEFWRIDVFELQCWRRHLRVPWTARRSSQSILKEISPEYSLEGLMMQLKLQYFGHLMQRNDSLEKTVMLEKFEGRKRRGRLKMRWLDGITD